MAKFKYTYIDEWFDNTDGTIHPVHQCLLNGKTKNAEYSIPASKKGTLHKLLKMYASWAKEPSDEPTRLSERSDYVYHIWNGIRLNGAADVLKLPYATRMDASEQLAKRVSSLAILHCSPAQLKAITKWDDVPSLVFKAIKKVILDKLDKAIQKAKDWDYLQNRLVPPMYRYNRFYELTGYLIRREFFETDLPLCLLNDGDKNTIMEISRDQFISKLFGNCTVNNTPLQLTLAIPTIWENYIVYGPKPVNYLMSVRYYTAAQFINIGKGGSAIDVSVPVTQEEIDYFNRAYVDKGNFVFLEGGETDAAKDVLRAVSHPNWCTGGSQNEAYSKAPFMVVFNDDNSPEVAVRWNFDKSKVEEIQGPMNNGFVTEGMKHTLATRVLPYITKEDGHTLCEYLDSCTSTKEWVTNPVSVSKMITEYNLGHDIHSHITEDHDVWAWNYTYDETGRDHNEVFFKLVDLDKLTLFFNPT